MNFQDAQFLTSYGIHSRLPEYDRPEIVFSGRSNVGKSSLINRLCQRKNLARVSSTPGKTVCINFYKVDCVYFVDLPGYGYAKVSREKHSSWQELVNGYFERISGKVVQDGIVIVQLLDCRRDPTPDDWQMLQYLQYYHLPCVAVLTKCDKLKNQQKAITKNKFTQMLTPHNCLGVCLTSATNGEGIETLRAMILDALSRARN